MKLGLIAKHSQQDRTAWRLLDLKPQRLQRCSERIGQLTPYPDLVAKAASASDHDRGFWLVPIEVLKDMRPPHVDSARCSDNGRVLLMGRIRHHSTGVIFENACSTRRIGVRCVQRV